MPCISFEHLKELRWVILKCVVLFIIGCLALAIFMQDSVKVLQVPLIKVEDFGEIGIDLQSVGLEEYVQTLERQEVDLGMLRNANEQDLQNWGITDLITKPEFLPILLAVKIETPTSYSIPLPIFIENEDLLFWEVGHLLACHFVLHRRIRRSRTYPKGKKSLFSWLHRSHLSIICGGLP